MSDYFSKLLFSQKFITSGSSLDPGFSNNGSKKLEMTQVRGRSVNLIKYAKITMVRAPSIITIILMTGNLEAYNTDRKEYRKKYLGNMAKTYLNF